MANRPRVHPRWSMGMRGWTGPRGKVQTDGLLRRERREGPLMLPEPVLRLAQDEYDRQFPGQPYERMQQRGGLSILEVISFMADRIERVEKLGPWKPAPSEPAVSAAPPTDAADPLRPEPARSSSVRSPK